MELLEGETLRERLVPGPLKIDALLDLGVQIADALETAHAGGILHRDIKPENIFVTRRGQAKLLDFGLAKSAEPVGSPQADTERPTAMDEKHLTGPGTAIGTVAYMSPEQARGEPLDARTDLFSCGTVLYEMATGRQPFAGGTSAIIFDAILNAAPVSPARLNPALPEGLSRIVATALEKDRDLRYQSASELKTDLKRLKRDSDSDRSGRTAAAPAPSRRRFDWRIAAGAAVVLAIGVIWAVMHRRAASPASAGQTVIAVLPFENLSGDSAIDYLGLALPDEIAATLSYAPGLAVRPFSSTRRYAGKNVDAKTAGREQNAVRVLTGQFQKEGDRLRVSMEVVDTQGDRVVWRDTATTPAANLMSLSEQMSQRVRQGLLPALGASAGTSGPATHPKNPEAYDLFLRSKPLTSDPGPNGQAMAMLERAVGLDPEYAPAWTALGQRYLYESQYGLDRSKAEEFLQRATTAQERALALDPNLSEAEVGLILLQSERGDNFGAYARARDLVRRRPQNGRAHFALSYVLRFSGMLEEAMRECDAALAADPHNRSLRSCGNAFRLSGKTGPGSRLLQARRRARTGPARTRGRHCSGRRSSRKRRGPTPRPAKPESRSSCGEPGRTPSAIGSRQRSRPMRSWTSTPSSASRAPSSSPPPGIRRRGCASFGAPSRQTTWPTPRWTGTPLSIRSARTPSSPRSAPKRSGGRRNSPRGPARGLP